MMDLPIKAFDISETFTISLDGPAASGKRNIGLILAGKFSFKYFQSSIVYRQLAFDCIIQKIDIAVKDAVITLSKAIKLDNNFHLKNENIGDIASQIALLSEIRNNLNKYLIIPVKTTPWMIMEGMDTGTVVAPDADSKIFITENTQNGA